MSGGPTRQDTYAIHVHIIAPGSDHLIDFGVWDKMTGGQVDSDETRYNPGAMGPPVSLGGRKTVENVTVSRLYRLVRDHGEAHRFINWAGRARMVVTKRPMDIEGNAYFGSPPIVYRGTLKRVQFPEVDSESSAAGLIELEMTIEGYPAST
jgi:hypothetical protein